MISAPLQAGEPALTAEGIRADLEDFRQGVKQRHVAPFARLPEHEFDSRIAALAARAEGLSFDQFVVEMMRIGAALGEGHTGVMAAFDRQLDLRVLPIDLWPVEGGYAVIAAPDEHSQLLGGQLISIEDVPVARMVEALTPLYSRDTEAALPMGMAALLRVPTLLHGSNILSGRRASYRVTVRTSRGTVERSLAPVSRFADSSPLSSPRIAGADASGEAPLWRRNSDRGWWRTLIHDGTTLYFDFNSADTGADPEFDRASFQRFLDDMVEEVSGNPVISRLVIDLRENRGGSYADTRGLLAAILQTGRFDERGKLFVITGPATFSAAMDHLSALERFMDPIIVGVAGAGRPGHGSELGRWRLPNSGMQARVSTVSAHDSREHRPAFIPHLYAPFTARDLELGRDPALAAIRAFDPARTLQVRLQEALAAGGVEGLLAAFESVKAEERWRYIFEEPVLNAIGYQLLRDGRPFDAVAVFQLNVREYPYSPNVYDSLGDALYAAGRYAEALDAYRRAMEMDRRYSYALPRVAELEALVERQPGADPR